MCFLSCVNSSVICATIYTHSISYTVISKHFPVRSKYFPHHPPFKIPSFCRKVKGNIYLCKLLPEFDNNTILIFELTPTYFLLPEAT